MELSRAKSETEPFKMFTFITLAPMFTSVTISSWFDS